MMVSINLQRILCAICIVSLCSANVMRENVSKNEWAIPPPIEIDPSCNVDGVCKAELSEGVFIQGVCAATCTNGTYEVYDYKGRNACGDDTCRCCVEGKEITRRALRDHDITCKDFNTKPCDDRKGYCQDWTVRASCDAGHLLGPNSQAACLDTDCRCCKKILVSLPVIVNNRRGVGHVFLDPHFSTFDGRKFDYEGKSGCSYILFQECSHDPLYVVVIHIGHTEIFEPLHVQDVTVHVGGIALTLVYGNDIYLNGKHLDKPLPWKSGNLTVRKHPEHVQVDLESKFSLLWDGKGRVVPQLDPSVHGKLCGLLGNADDNADNDFQMKMADGTLKSTDDITSFVGSWVLPGSC